MDQSHNTEMFSLTHPEDPSLSEELLSSAVNTLSEFIRIPTINPPGNDKKGGEFLESFLNRFGVPTERLQTGKERFSLMAHVPGEDPELAPLVLINHFDVVPAEGEEWEVPPFSGEIKDGYIWGRGTLDMKGMGIMELFAFLLARENAAELSRRGKPMNRGFTFLAVPDEETGGKEGAAAVAEGFMDKLNPDCMVGEGGFGLKDMMVKGVTFPIDITEKRQMKIRLTARGREGHANQPPPDSAIGRLAKALTKIPYDFYPMRVHPVVGETFRRLGEKKSFPENIILKNASRFPFRQILDRAFRSDKTLRAMTRNTISPTIINAGEATNHIPGRAEAILDIRMLPGVKSEEIKKDIVNLIGDDKVDVEIIRRFEKDGVSSWTHRGFTLLEEVLTEEVDEAFIVPLLDVGGTDMKQFRPLGVPCFGIVPVVIDEAEMGRVHGKNERISVENLALGIRVLYKFILRYCLK